MALLRVTNRQHTVSRAVLRQFTRRNGLVLHDAKRQIFISKGPNGGFHMPFDQYDPASSEQLWRKTEERIPKMYAALHARSAEGNADAEEIVRAVIALHWTRSTAMRIAHEQLTEQVKRRSVTELAQNQYLLQHAMLKSIGLHAPGSAAREWFNEEIHRRVVGENSEQWWSERNAHHFASAQQLLERWHLQFGYTRDGSDLIISDAPVLTMKPRHMGLGPHQGVALGEATMISMPLSPNVMVALGPEPKTTELTSEDVALYNELQIRARIRWLACRPSGPSEKILRATLPVRSQS